MESKQRSKNKVGFLEAIDGRSKQIHLYNDDAKQKQSQERSVTQTKTETSIINISIYEKKGYNQQSTQSVVEQKSHKKRNNIFKENIKQSKSTVAVQTTQNTFLKRIKLDLKQRIKKMKIKSIIQQFVKKLSLNSPYKNQNNLIFEFQNQKIQTIYLQGIYISQNIQKVLQLIRVIFQIFLIYIFTLSIGFNIAQQISGYYTYVPIIIGIFSLQILLNFIIQKNILGTQLKYIRQISFHYVTTQFFIDLLILIVLLLQFNNIFQYHNILKLVILAKLPNCLQKIQKLQFFFIQSTYKEQYWSVVKIFLFNFCYAHFLAILLNSMAQINVYSQKNWYQKIDIKNARWNQKYIWSYYWAVNIMLTVGFGDISANNSTQAFCLIFIQTFSCIVLAYNITNVGSLITNIRNQGLQKKKRTKIFRNLSKRNNISSQLVKNIFKYIKQSNEMKKKFNIEDENKFVSELPTVYRQKYLIQSNKSIFQNISFFKNLVYKAIVSLSQQIQISITHPEQIIVSQDNFLNIYILKQGEIGYVAKKYGCSYNQKIISKYAVSQNQNAYLIGLDFIKRQKPQYEVISIGYSVLYKLKYQNFIECLKKCKGNFEYYCYLRDKCKNIFDQFEVFPCDECKDGYHTKFNCPKYHFLPIKQQVIFKEIQRSKLNKNSRYDLLRIQSKINTLKFFSFLSREKQNIPYSITLRERKKKKNFFFKQNLKIESVKIIQRQNLQNAALLLCNTAQSIKMQLNDLVRKQNYQDEIWLIKLDSMQNYKIYFPDDNSSNLSSKFIFKRKKQTSQIQTNEINLQDLSFSYDSHSFNSWSEKQQQIQE